MAPPLFAHLGAACQHLLDLSYILGVFRINCKTTTNPIKTDFTTTGDYYYSSQKLFGRVELNPQLRDQGIYILGKWNNEGLFSLGIIHKDKLLEGLRLGIEGSYDTSGDGQKKIKLLSGYENDFAQTELMIYSDIDKIDKPELDGSLVVGYLGFLAGARIGFNTEEQNISSSQLALAYALHPIEAVIKATDFNTFAISLYGSPAECVDTGIMMEYKTEEEMSSTNPSTKLGVRYKITEDSTVMARFDRELQAGLGFRQKLYDGIYLTISALIDGNKLDSEGNHKFGALLDLFTTD